jgi:uncharacterized protein with HXXEE motif
MHALLFDWPSAGLVLAALLAAALIREAPGAGPAPWRNPAWVLGWLWPMYLLHQFEEHGMDLLGRRYAFLASLCELLGHPSVPDCPATPAFIFSVNVIACQVAFGLAFFLRRTKPLVAACVWGIPLVNLFAHLVPAVVTGRYNPGLLTALVLFAPGCAWMLWTVRRSGVLRPGSGWRIVATGVLTHLVLIASIELRAGALISPAAVVVVNALNGGWALLLGRVPAGSRVAGDPT